MTRSKALVGALVVVALVATTVVVWLAVRHPNTAARLQGHVAAGAALLDIPHLPPGQVSVRLDPGAMGSQINPLIYGVAAADASTVRELGATLDRAGGNPSSRYNWVVGASNAGRDWQFRNVTLGSPAAADDGIAATLAAGATPLLTLPTLGWVARDGDNRTQSHQVPAQGGPPLRPGSDGIAGYDPAANRQATSIRSFPRKPALESNSAAPAVYQDEYVRHLAERFGSVTHGALYIAMDNEPDLWSSTHTDVHPVRMGYDAMLRNFLEYASMVKDQAPALRILGPDVSGWTSYIFSDSDRGDDNFASHADRRSHGDEAFLPWWLHQVARSDAVSGRRTLDFLDVHYYPQAQNVYSAAADPATQARRIRSVRSLYDPTFQDESWIATNVMLIPRLKRWIAENYPGTGLAITEYSWGGEKDASGAVAEAEVLGVFGREGVDLAAYWTYPPPDSPIGAAFRLYRKYDGRGATFGDRSIPVSSSSREVTAFAARHTDSGEVDVVIVNESRTGPTSVSLNLGKSRAYLATPYCIPPGSATIVRRESEPAASAVRLPPLGLCLLKLLPT